MLKAVLKVIDQELDHFSADNYPHHLYLSDDFIIYSYLNQGLQDLRNYIIDWCDGHSDHLNVTDAIQNYIYEMDQNACKAKNPEIGLMYSCYYDEAFYVLHELLPHSYHKRYKSIRKGDHNEKTI